MTVETYSRLAYGPTDAAEQLVLQRVRSVIDSRGEDAVILVNLLLGRHEIDLIVATQTATLVMEVKGYLQAVRGDINSRWWKTVATGERRSNAYEKIDSAHMDLKDALRTMTGSDPGYAHAVVLLAYGRPMGSNLPKSDHRVTITELEALGSLLSTPVRPGTLRRLWGLDVVRQFARTQGLALLSTAAPIASVPLAEARYAQVAHESDARGMMADAVPQVVDRPAPPILDATPTRPPKKRTALIAVIVSLIGLPILVGSVSELLRHPSSVPSRIASASGRAHEASRRRVHIEATRRARIERARGDRSESPSALLDAQAANLQVQTARSSQSAPAAPLPPCPAGVDRLGCVPDPKTLAKLRGSD